MPCRRTLLTANVDIDSIVIGAGVVGLAVARALALAGREVFVLESRAGSADDPLVKRGEFQAGPPMGLETHVKDAAKGGWAFYGFGRDGGPAAMIAKTASCYSCHQDHAQTDTVFTQYYPTLARK